MNFSQAYSPAPTCAPSRASIIIGQHPAYIQESGYLITAPIPAEVNQIRFLVIDENNYQRFSELTVRSSKLTK